ncbi:uncharacterized protein LOC118771463 [Megalops cyprinoides]|uniref:uncharacterized protein LOC118771463 n=1 Tax=Megalops cyprinoides TaxID=118141 RepID=UPI001864CDA8|nr:uncharacterized protein LOC118771463 [Megalops cyprinoides]
MAPVKSTLVSILDDLEAKDFKRFTWYLYQDELKEVAGVPHIPKGQLEGKDRHEVVDKMVDQYGKKGACRTTQKILKKMQQNELAQKLKETLSSDAQFGKELEEKLPDEIQILKELQKEFMKTIIEGISDSDDSDEDSDDSDEDSDDSDEDPDEPDEDPDKPVDSEDIICSPEEFQKMKQCAVDVTLDPDTASPILVLSEDGKRLTQGRRRQDLPENPQRFNPAPNVVGKEGFSSGRAYWEVHVGRKTEWDLGVARESVSRKGKITLCPENGFWTIWLRNGRKYTANSSPPVPLTLRVKPQTVGMFVDYERGQISFYNAETRSHIYTFTGYTFMDKVYPFFSPCGDDGGKNKAPMVICQVDTSLHAPEHMSDFAVSDVDLEKINIALSQQQEMKMSKMQNYAADVTLDPDTANPKLILSEDRKEVRHGDREQALPDRPERFNRIVNVLGKEGFSSGRAYWEVHVGGKMEWDLGVARESVSRKGRITLCPENGFWILWLRKKDGYEALDDPSVSLTINERPQKVGVFVDYEMGQVSFYNVEARSHIYTFTDVFKEKIYPFFSPCSKDGGENAAPLIISSCIPRPLSSDHLPDSTIKTDAHLGNVRRTLSQLERVELKMMQQYAVEVTLDCKTANPKLILSKDGRRVRHGNREQKLPDNRERFNRTPNVLGKEGFSSGRAYWEVHVGEKTDWDLGVVRESISRKGRITLCPENGYWILGLRNRKKYWAVESPAPVLLALRDKLQKVGVFVDYEEGQVSFYNVNDRSHIYSFTGYTFREKLYPFFSPCVNDGGENAAPMVICPCFRSPLPEGLSASFPNADVLFRTIRKTVSQLKEMELWMMQKHAVAVTLDPDTAHRDLTLSADGRGVRDEDAARDLPANPERFNRSSSVLAKEGFTSGRAYWEVLVNGKTAWTLGVARESINRKGRLTLSPEDGFWTIWLRSEKYSANSNPAVPLTLRVKPQKVGVFVDYEEGQVSFYNVNDRSHIYSFTGYTFREKLYPFFSPCGNDGGANSAPLIITPLVGENSGR